MVKGETVKPDSANNVIVKTESEEPDSANNVIVKIAAQLAPIQEQVAPIHS
ncbi:MAG: hypothetical protein KME31_04065 [Tolypothrix carrinoi HA7290-LM1]|jgi:hypothetical protein|nr:hypothetical protein [Tolypothrix carrinoi HA7290-LM1]